MADKNINWKQFEADMNKVLLDLPDKMGKAIVNWSKNRFRTQSWADGGDFPWKPRKRGAKRSVGRAILIDTGRLRRSIRIIRTTKHSVTIGSDVPYADAHNEGFTGTVTVKAHHRRTFGKVEVYSIKTQKKRKVKAQTGIGMVSEHKREMNIPRRRFLGESKDMNAMLARLIESEISKVLK